MIDYEAIMAGRLGASEKAGLERLAKSVAAGDGVARRGSREGMVEALPLLRRYDTRCFALEVLGDGEVEEEMEERVREQRQKRKQQQQRQRQQQIDRDEAREGHQEVYFEDDDVMHEVKEAYGEDGKEDGDGDDGETVGAGRRKRSKLAVAEQEVEEVELVTDVLEERGSGRKSNEGRSKEANREEENKEVENREEENKEEEKTEEQRGEKKRRRGRRREDGVETSKPATPPGETVKVRGKNVVMPHGWRFEEVQLRMQGDDGVLRLEKLPTFVSPEDIVCFGVGMMEGCESTRRRPTLNFERSVDLLKADVVRMAKLPLLGELGDKAMGRDSVMVYRRGMALRLKAQRLAEAHGNAPE